MTALVSALLSCCPVQANLSVSDWKSESLAPATTFVSCPACNSETHNQDIYLDKLWHMEHRLGHSLNKHRTNLRPHRPKWKEVCSTSHARTNICVTEGTKVLHIISNAHEKNEVVLGRTHQPPQRRPMGLACRHWETIRQEKTTRETSQAVEGRPGQILERHIPRVNMAAQCWWWRRIDMFVLQIYIYEGHLQRPICRWSRAHLVTSQ